MLANLGVLLKGANYIILCESIELSCILGLYSLI